MQARALFDQVQRLIMDHNNKISGKTVGVMPGEDGLYAVDQLTPSGRLEQNLLVTWEGLASLAN